jgi:hypothetical protein
MTNLRKRVLSAAGIALCLSALSLPVAAQVTTTSGNVETVAASRVKSADRTQHEKDAAEVRRLKERLEAAKENSQIELLRAQLQTMKDYDQRLLSTVYWSLGGVAGLAILLCGYSWYNNNVLFQREKEITRKEIREMLRSDFNDEFATAKGEVSDLLKTEIERNNQRHDLLHNGVMELMSGYNSSHTARIADHSHRIYMCSAEIAILKNNFTGLISESTFELDRLARKLGFQGPSTPAEGNDYDVQRLLRMVLTGLTSAEEQGRTINLYTLECFELSLKKLPSVYESEVGQITVIMKKVVGKENPLLSFVQKRAG